MLPSHRTRLNLPVAPAAKCWAAVLFLILSLSGPYSSVRGQTDGQPTQATSVDDPYVIDTEMTQILSGILKDENLPALFAARYVEGEPLRVAALGLRRIKSKKAVTVDDLIHIGSCTKAMTATLVGVLVERKKLAWGSTIAEVLPRLSQKIHAGYHDVTIEQLLTHQSGMPANPPNWWLKEGDSINEIRRNILVDGLAKQPIHEPGTRYLYSNLGYMTAGLMAAQVTGKDWETLITEELFVPLEMRSAGFGAPGTPNKIDQPWGHRLMGKLILPRQGDNAPALGPAGTVHLSMADWARFGAVHLNLKPNPIVSAETLEHLHHVPQNTRSTYALGWGIRGRGQAFVHSGSNTVWMAKIKVVPKTGTVYMAVCNAGSGPDIDRLVQKVMTQIEALDRPEKN